MECAADTSYLVGTAADIANGQAECKVCAESINNCQRCSRDGSVCLQCKPTFKLHSNSNNGVFDRCVACDQANQYVTTSVGDGSGSLKILQKLLINHFFVDICHYCSESIAFCGECGGNPNKCTKCSEGYLFDTDGNTSDYEQCNRCFEPSFFVEESKPRRYCFNIKEDIIR